MTSSELLGYLPCVAFTKRKSERDKKWGREKWRVLGEKREETKRDAFKYRNHANRWH